MAINKTGKPDTRDYVLGRGIIYLAELSTGTGLPGAYRDLGNAPSFAFTVETEDLEHQNSRTGLKVTDKRAVISQTVSINFSIDELNHDNVSLFFTGTVDSFANPAVAGVTPAVIITTAVKKGFHYPLLTAYDGTGSQVVLADSTGLTVRRDPSGTPVTLVEGTDYEVDHATGQIFFLASSVTVIEGDEIDWSVTAQAGAPATLERMQALKGSVKNYALRFKGENPLNNSEILVVDFYSVQVSADGDLNMISDEISVAAFSGTAQSNSAIGSSGKTFDWISAVRS